MISKNDKKQVLKRANRLCEYCLAPADYAFHPFCIDHIIPLSKKGTNDLMNLAYSCQNYNGAKYNKVEGLDPITKSASKLFNPRIDDWKKHFVWDDSGTILIGISSCERATVKSLKMNLPSVKNIRKALVEIGVHPPTLST